MNSLRTIIPGILQGCVFLVLISNASSIAQVPADTAPSLKVYFPLDGSFKDMSGNFFQCQTNNVKLTSNIKGKPDHACDFTDPDAYINTNFNPDIYSTFSISVWVYPYWISDSMKRDTFYVWSFDDLNNIKSLCILDSVWTVVLGKNIWKTTLAADRELWQHIVVMFSSSDIVLFKNGHSEKYGKNPLKKTTTGNLTFGNMAVINKHPCNGRIDEIKVFDKALKGWEVTELFMYSFSEKKKKIPYLDALQKWFK